MLIRDRVITPILIILPSFFPTDDVLVPDKLMPILNIGKNSVRLKPNVDLSKYERLFAIDESLKPVSTILI